MEIVSEHSAKRPQCRRPGIKGEYYSNILMMSRENKPLTTIGEKRAEWYLKKGLGEEVTEPAVLTMFPSFSRIIRLKFKAKMEERTDPFYLQVQETKCVVCGSRDNLSLHHVVPSVIRQHFSEEDKNHAHSWCVLLCHEHHHHADQVALEVHDESKKKLEKDIVDYIKAARDKWGQEFIANAGGADKLKELYREKFMALKPAHLPDGFLEDHKVSP